MKTITVRLTQEPEKGLYRVKSFANTVDLQVGQIVQREKVMEWCAWARVNVYVVGATVGESQSNLALTPNANLALL